MSSNYASDYRGFAAALLAAIALIVGGFIAFSGSNSANAAAEHSAHNVALSNDVSHAGLHANAALHKKARRTKTVRIYSNMRTLWDHHMQWTWDTIVAFAAESPGLEPTLNRLLKNQKDIGNAVKPYYGKKAGNQLAQLLTEHIELAVPVLTAAKEGDQAGLDKAISNWYVNAEQIGDFLAKANKKNWKRATMRKMMRGHITQTVTYASDVLNGNWTSAVRNYDRAQSHMTQMADQLAGGIISQFPKKF